MSLLATATKCSEMCKSPKGIIYGPPGVGKTTFGANADAAIILDCENGTSRLTCGNATVTPYLTTWLDIDAWLTELATTPHQYRAVVVDSLDWMMHRMVEKVAGIGPGKMDETLNRCHGGYGNGKQVLHNYMYQSLLPLLDKIVNKGIAVILLSHASKQDVMGADGISLNKTTPDLPKDLLNPMAEWSDFIGAASYANDGGRILILNETPQLVAKNRYGITQTLPLRWSAFIGAIDANLNHKPKEMKDNGNY